MNSKPLKILVGETGFEPATLCSQSRCATRLRHSPRPGFLRDSDDSRKRAKGNGGASKALFGPHSPGLFPDRRQGRPGPAGLIREVTNIVTSLDSLERRAGASAPLAYAPGVAGAPPAFPVPGGTPPGAPRGRRPAVAGFSSQNDWGVLTFAIILSRARATRRGGRRGCRRPSAALSRGWPAAAARAGGPPAGPRWRSGVPPAARGRRRRRSIRA